MTASRAAGPGWGLIYDPALVADPAPTLLDPAAWKDQHTGAAGRGRGGVTFVSAPGGEWAIRHYRRGGLFGRLVRDHYLWTGDERTRSWSEWRMLEALRARGLPVPRPVAALFRRSGLLYTADIATVRIPYAEPLSARLAGAGPDAQPWAVIGRTIAGFHAAGAFHPDLNAHNILVDAAGQPWLIDFDKGKFRSEGDWRRSNLQRLERSLHKIAAEPGAPPFSAEGWNALVEGYAEGGAGLR
ncbi:MAG: 3-deoxy-D-manno-octulosonic acid kinase [Gammaproteobacteria bacterium]